MRLPGVLKKYSDTPETRKKIYIFLACLLFSAISWLFTELSGETTISIPIKASVSNIPEGTIISYESDSIFSIETNATGLKIINNRLRQNINKVDIEFLALQRMNRDNKQMHFYTGNQIEMRFAMESGFSRNNLNARPDTLFFNVDKAFSKKIPVFPKTDITYRKGFKNYGQIGVSPDSVLIYGPENALQPINSIETSTLVLDDVNNQINEEVKLQLPDIKGNVKLSDNKVDVIVEVEKFTEAMIELPIQIPNCESIDSASTQIMVFPDKVEVFYLIALKDAGKISSDMITATIECPATGQKESNRTVARINKKPEWVEILRIKPAEVEFIVVEK